MDSRLVAALNLSKRYEERLLHGISKKRKAVPAVVVTGFLGTGKTTMVQHLLRNRGNLRLAVLVNEVGQVDLDSQLVNLQQSNASVGVPSVNLSGGCACCTVHGDLVAALKQLAAQAADLDYMVLETSGAAVAEPLADALLSCGFTLELVVALVDADAGAAALQQELAQAQVRAADLVVVNKCDLAGLVATSAVEDAVQVLAPGVRMVRARFGQVDPHAILDMQEEEGGGGQGGAAAAGPAADTAGSMAFLSHEPVASTSRQRRRPEAAAGSGGGSGSGSRGRSKLAAAWSQQHDTAADASTTSSTTGGDVQRPANGADHEQHGHHHHHHHQDSQQQQQDHPGSLPARPHLHGSFHTLSITLQQPLSMAAFQQYVVQQLLPCRALTRAKGIVWMAERRADRFVFHLSGRQRVQCCSEGPWEGPPGCQLVLIGQQQQELQRLAHAFTQLQQAPPGPGQAGAGAGASGVGASGVGASANGAAAAASLAAASKELVSLVREYQRLQVVGAGGSGVADHGQQAAASGADGHSSSESDAGAHSSVVEFSSEGSPLHGVIAEEVNAQVMRRVNATGKVLLYGRTAPPLISSVSGLQSADRMSSLMICPLEGGAGAAAQQWQEVEGAMAPVLRKAFQHVHNCKCDMVMAHAAAQ